MFLLVYNRCNATYHIQGAAVPLRPGERVMYTSDRAWDELKPIAEWLQKFAERTNTDKRRMLSKV